MNAEPCTRVVETRMMKVRRRRSPPRPRWEENAFESMNLQKEILWLVVTEGVVAREDLLACFSWTGEMDLDLLIEGMVGNGLFEEVGGYLRIHPEFAKNCYTVIR